MRALITSYFAEHDGDFAASCEKQSSELHREGYPVLKIGPVTIYPTVEQLATIRDACAAYIQANLPDSADASDAFLATPPEDERPEEPDLDDDGPGAITRVQDIENRLPDDDREAIAPGDERYYRPPGAADK